MSDIHTYSLPSCEKTFECYSMHFKDGKTEQLRKWLLECIDLPRKAIKRKDSFILPRFYDMFNINLVRRYRFRRYKEECEGVDNAVYSRVQKG